MSSKKEYLSRIYSCASPSPPVKPPHNPCSSFIRFHRRTLEIVLSFLSKQTNRVDAKQLTLPHVGTDEAKIGSRGNGVGWDVQGPLSVLGVGS